MPANGDLKKLLNRVSGPVGILLGFAAALFLTPVTLALVTDLSPEAFVTVTGYACSIGIIMSALVVTIVAAGAVTDSVNDVVARNHNEVIVRIAELKDQLDGFEARLHHSCERLTRLVEENRQAIEQREVAYQQAEFNAVADGAELVLGGRDVVDRTGTEDVGRRMERVRTVVPMVRPPNCRG